MAAVNMGDSRAGNPDTPPCQTARQSDLVLPYLLYLHLYCTVTKTAL